jgi:Raf kinase inhibitor-like YbhB/YbcL family protein
MDTLNKLCPKLLIVTFLALGAYGCSADASDSGSPTAGELAAPAEQAASAPDFDINSPAFAQDEAIPTQFTCDGDDVSPALEWRDPPQDTKSFALVADDPDAPAGTWVHWVLYNLPADARGLPQAVPSDGDLTDGSRHGTNSWKRLGYGGPCPPSGTHRYFFKLYALDITLDLEPGATKDQLLQAMEGHILAQTDLMGTYTRQ